MIAEHIAEQLIIKLNSVRAEPTIVARRYKFKNIVYSITDVSAYELLLLIISFQVDELFKEIKPKFNTIKSTDIIKDIIFFFNTQNKTVFRSLPYISQQLIYLMTSLERIGLSLQDIISMDIAYKDPYAWMAQYALPADEVLKCPLCGTPEGAGNLCCACKDLLTSITDFRHESFTLLLTNKLSTIPTKDYGTFSFTHKQYSISRESLNTIKFEVIAGTNTQLELPFIEYQKEIEILRID